MSVRYGRIFLRASLSCLVGAAVAALWLPFTARDQGLTGTIIQAVSAVLVPAAGLGMWLVRKRPAVRSIELDAAADRLAIAAKARWEGAAAERRLRYPGRIPVRWSWSNRLVFAPRADALGTFSTSPRMAVLPGL